MSSSGKEKTDAALQELQASIPRLRASLVDLMKVATDSLAHQLSLENTAKPSSTGDAAATPSSQPPTESFDKALNEFYKCCDLVTLHFTVAYDCYNVSDVSNQFSPMPIRAPNSESDAHQSYSDFIVSTNKQVTKMEQALTLLEKFSSELSGTPS